MAVNPDLAKERAVCPFDKEELTYLLDGGRDKTEKRRRIEKEFLSAEMLDNDTVVESLSSVERYDYDIKKSIELLRLTQKISEKEGIAETSRQMLGSGAGAAVLPDGNPFAQHMVMFLPTIMGQATPDQQGEWLGRAWQMDGVLGTFAQTELGHGTNVRGLETTATYDADAQQFVLHSPTLSSLKWWPGGLGKSVNHAVVVAQLITQGAKRGPHQFIVQLRDIDTHVPLKGIQVGEIGPKFGMNSNDNGFLRFDQHRIPRSHMLMKNAQVLPDGTYVSNVKAELRYGTMMFVRVSIVIDTSLHLKKAATIAVRYSAVRRQSELRPGEPEPQILDYQTQQLKLLPAVALCFALSFSSERLNEDYNDVQNDIDTRGDLSRLAEMHALSCGLKALATAEAADAIDELRRACGGHGYMVASNLPRLCAIVTAARTYEGENTVLLLQVARFLVKCHRQSLDPRAQKLVGSVAYLNREMPGRPRLGTDSDLIEGMCELFASAAKGLLHQAVSSLDSGAARASHPADAWNGASVELCLAADAHMRYYVVRDFADVINGAKVSDGVAALLLQVFEFFTANWIVARSGDFMRFAGMSGHQLEALRYRMNGLLQSLRKVAVNIVDAFDIPDASLKSTLGAHDGRVYERMFEAAMKGPLNKTDVPDTFHKHIKPLFKAHL